MKKFLFIIFSAVFLFLFFRGLVQAQANCFGNFLVQITPVPTATPFASPYGIALDNSGNIYVADSQNNAVYKLDPSGNQLAYWTNGYNSTTFNSPYAVALGNNLIYVADAFNNAIQVLNTSGVPQAEWTMAGSNSLNTPAGVLVDGSGNVYVADSGDGFLYRFTSGGVLDTNFDGTGYTNVSSPSGLALDGSGNLYVTCNSFIQEYNSSGGTIQSWSAGAVAFNTLEQIAVDSTGNIFVADAGNSLIQEIPATGSPVSFGGGRAR